MSFWWWFARSGLRAVVLDLWFPVHVAVGVALASLVRQPMSQIAAVAFLPLASILVGLAFAWAGNALAVLQTPELRKLTTQPGAPGFAAYLFTYQLAVLAVLVTLVCWGLIALGATASTPGAYRPAELRFAGRAAVFALTSISIRECWQVMVATLHAMIVRHNLQNLREQQEADGGAHVPDDDEP